MSVLWFNNFSIKNYQAYRQLANGWVSIYPSIHLDGSLSAFDKIKSIVAEDIVHGRFRPAFFTYISISYIVSPVIHERLSEMPERSYQDLMTGDLQMFSYILLLCVVVTMTLLSHLIYGFTGSRIFCLIPIFFIPLSPSLTENLLQNYIDSQEIPLVLWLSLWIYSFFIFLNNKYQFLKRIGVVIVSLVSLLLLFLTKETSVVVACGIGILFLLVLALKNKELYDIQIENLRFLSANLLFSILFAISIVMITTFNKSGYADAYILDYSKLLKTINKLWGCVTKYSLNHYLSYVPVCVAFILLIVKRKESINRVPVHNHILFFFLLLSLSAGFFLVLIPWEPVLVKYTYPSVFLFSFLVAYSLSTIYSWSRTLAKPYVKICVLSYSFLFVPFFVELLPAATQERNYSTELSDYGLETIYELSDNITDDILNSGIKFAKVLFLIDSHQDWKTPIKLQYIHLARYLNFKKNININAKNGRVLRNVKMPKGELTSFKYHKNEPGVYLSTKESDLHKLGFDNIYVAYLIKNVPANYIVSKMSKYILTQDRIVYQGKPHFQSFVIYKYRLITKQ